MQIRGKKLIITAFITAIFIFTLSCTVWGEITVTGVVNLKYDPDYNQDFYDSTLSFNGQINDNATAYASIVLQNQRNSPNVFDLSKSVFCFTYYLRPNPGYFLVGCFNNNNAGDLVALSSAVNEQRSYLGVKFEYPFSPNFWMKAGFYPNEQNHPVKRQFASTIGATYFNNRFKADANVVKFSNTDPLYYTANFRYKPISLITTYGQYGCGYLSSGAQNIEEILGLMISFPPAELPLSINFEYNFKDDDNGGGPIDSNHYGYRILYEIDKNISLSYYRTISPNQYNEIRLRIAW
jgi:hypothetical protein